LRFIFIRHILKIIMTLNIDFHLLVVTPCSLIGAIISEGLNASIIRIDIINNLYTSAILCGIISQITGPSFTSIINQQLHLHNFHIKHLKSLRHVSNLSDHHQGALARNNKAPWWWSDKFETCRSDFKCF